MCILESPCSAIGPVDLTESFLQHVPQDIRGRYEFAETRNAAAILAATNPVACQQVLEVLRGFQLKTKDLLTPGGQQSD